MNKGFFGRVFSSEYGHQALLACLGILILSAPFLQGFKTVNSIMSLLFILVLLAAVRVLSSHRAQLILALLLVLPALLAHLGIIANQKGLIFSIRDLATSVFLFVVCGILLRDIITRSREVTADLIFGSVSVYLMSGLAFAFLYSFIEYNVPGSFAGLDSVDPASDPLDTFFYFSFVTMSTLGYGDVLPLSNFARTFAFVEAVWGQLFLAILVARLVGLYVARQDLSR